MVRKLDFINANAGPPSGPTIWSSVADIWHKVWAFIACMIVVTLSAAAIYWFGSPYGWGIQQTFVSTPDPWNLPTVGFWDCLYFSVITITTLGYGDYRPESYGRIVASIEVLSGIVLMGIFVSRLVSGQLDRRSKRIARGQLNSEIQEFRNQLLSVVQGLSATPLTLLTNQPSALLYRARGLADSIARYWRHEARDPDLEETIPLRAASRLLGELIELLDAIEVGAKGKLKPDLHLDDHRAIRRISEATLVLATVLFERTQDDGLLHAYDRVCEIVSRLRGQLALRDPVRSY
jgi:hypothetical protein